MKTIAIIKTALLSFAMVALTASCKETDPAHDEEQTTTLPDTTATDTAADTTSTMTTTRINDLQGSEPGK